MGRQASGCSSSKEIQKTEMRGKKMRTGDKVREIERELKRESERVRERNDTRKRIK